MNAHSTPRGVLVDRGANGGVAGADTRLTRTSGCHANITGIDNHKIKNAGIGTCGRVVDTDQGTVKAILGWSGAKPNE